MIFNLNTLSLKKMYDKFNLVPAPGMMASFVSGNPSLAVVEAILKSQLKAISNPPPSAAPSNAVIVGTGSSFIRWNNILARETNMGTSASLIFLLSFKSAPKT